MKTAGGVENFDAECEEECMSNNSLKFESLKI